MPALNFKKQFAPLIESGEKRQTIRRIGKSNGWIEGARLYLYTGQRTNQCRKLGEAKIAAIRRVTIHEAGVYLNGEQLVGESLIQFVKADGFDSVDDFFAFFNEQRGDEPFVGRVIYWTASTGNTNIGENDGK
jgi:hypothetical protein